MSEKTSPFKLEKARMEELEFAWNKLCQSSVSDTISKLKHFTSLNPNEYEIAYLGFRLGQSHVIRGLHEENVQLGVGVARMEWIYKWIMIPTAVIMVLVTIFTVWNVLGGYEILAARNGWTPPTVQKAALPEYLKQKVYTEIILYNE